MNSKTKATIAGLLTLLIAAPAFAEVGTAVTVSADASVTTGGGTVRAGASANLEARISKGKERADQEIQRRIDALNAANTRVEAMVRVSASQKSSISKAVSNQISVLTSLKAKIDAVFGE